MPNSPQHSANSNKMRGRYLRSGLIFTLTHGFAGSYQRSRQFLSAGLVEATIVDGDDKLGDGRGPVELPVGHVPGAFAWRLR